MPRFEPYSETTQLPEPGAIETNTLDFKGRLVAREDGSIDHSEIAKDVAAFANLAGGVILVGAYEDEKRGVLGKIKGLAEEEAKATREACGRAVLNFCRPSPVCDSVKVHHLTGVVVAINVWPFVGQAVGVRHEKYENVYSFPLRVGIDCKHLTPEQLPMLMLPDLRRVVVLLNAIPPDSAIRFQAFRPNGTPCGVVQYVFHGINELDFAVTLSAPGGAPFSIPLDLIKSVWKGQNTWCVNALYEYN